MEAKNKTQRVNLNIVIVVDLDVMYFFELVLPCNFLRNCGELRVFPSMKSSLCNGVILI